MGRPPIGKRPMTAAERQRRHRDKRPVSKRERQFRDVTKLAIDKATAPLKARIRELEGELAGCIARTSLRTARYGRR